jgi:hypothetical protein
VRDEIRRPERILVGQERKDVVHPAADVRLPESNRHLPVEEVADVEHLEVADIDARDRQRSAAAHRVVRLAKRVEAVGLKLRRLQHALERRPLGFHADRVDHRVGPAPVRQLAYDPDDVAD